LSWGDFRKEYEERGLPCAAPGTRQAAGFALDHFERLAKPVRVRTINSRTFAGYVAARQLEHTGRDHESGPVVSPATVNKELRTLRAVIRKAHKWGYLPNVPEIEFLSEPCKLPTYVTPEHFAKLYQSAGAARWPACGPFATADWWRALLVSAYMTGWRIGALLALCREDVNLDEGWAISRAADNKGKRDQRVPLHPLVVQHLRKLISFSPLVFPWNHGRRDLFLEFQRFRTPPR